MKMVGKRWYLVLIPSDSILRRWCHLMTPSSVTVPRQLQQRLSYIFGFDSFIVFFLFNIIQKQNNYHVFFPGKNDRRKHVSYLNFKNIWHQALVAGYRGMHHIHANSVQRLHQFHKPTRPVFTEYLHKILIPIYQSHFHLRLQCTKILQLYIQNSKLEHDKM